MEDRSLKKLTRFDLQLSEHTSRTGVHLVYQGLFLQNSCLLLITKVRSVMKLNQKIKSVGLKTKTMSEKMLNLRETAELYDNSFCRFITMSSPFNITHVIHNKNVKLVIVF